MRYLAIILATVLISSCGSNATTEDATTVDSARTTTDSTHNEDDEMAEDIIEGSFDALNR